MKLFKLLVFLVVVFISTSVMSQTYAELRGGITFNPNGGVIGAAVIQELGNVNISGVFNVYGIGGYNRYDSYDIEAGYIIGNDNISILPILGIRYNNQQKFNEIPDSISGIFGASVEKKIQYFKVGMSYRQSNLSTAFIFVKIPLIPSNTNKHRFF